MNWERRLPPVAKDALDTLREAAENETDTGDEGGSENEESDLSKADFTKERAVAVLVADEEFTEADVEYALDLLERRGHIYYVDDEVSITPTDG